MKKIILLALAALMIGSCNEKRKLTKYEVLLSTQDTIYVDAWRYYSDSDMFTTNRTTVFYDVHNKELITINDPIYIREIR